MYVKSRKSHQQMHDYEKQTKIMRKLRSQRQLQWKAVDLEYEPCPATLFSLLLNSRIISQNKKKKKKEDKEGKFFSEISSAASLACQKGTHAITTLIFSTPL